MPALLGACTCGCQAPSALCKPPTPRCFLPALFLIARAQVSWRGAALHHYISRSLADFEVKQARRAGDGSVKTLAHFLEWAREATETCDAAAPLGRALAARYDLARNVPPRCLQWAEP